MALSEGSTTQFGNSAFWSLQLQPGPYWSSYDQLKQSGSTALERIKPLCVGTVATKTGVYRILRDTDYQKLIGLAADVHRLKTGVRFVVNVAKVVEKHRDQESIDLLVQTVAMLGESPVLPERDGHQQFEISPEEAAANTEEIDFDRIPRPSLSQK
jgi:hypothetical protein